MVDAVLRYAWEGDVDTGSLMLDKPKYFCAAGGPRVQHGMGR